MSGRIRLVWGLVIVVCLVVLCGWFGGWLSCEVVSGGVMLDGFRCVELEVIGVCELPSGGFAVPTLNGSLVFGNLTDKVVG